MPSTIPLVIADFVALVTEIPDFALLAIELTNAGHEPAYACDVVWTNLDPVSQGGSGVPVKQWDISFTGVASPTKQDIIAVIEAHTGLPPPPPEVTGTRNDNPALESLLTILAAKGIITDSSINGGA